MKTSTGTDTRPTTLVVMGVSGSGKSTLAEALADRLGWDLQEGDDLHPAANVAKMAAGIPLTDEDRQPWLETIRDRIVAQQCEGKPGIMTCSALRHRYREVLAQPGVMFVHLSGSHDTIAERLDRRKGHFMPASLLDSQLETLEPLGPEEPGIVIDATLPVQESTDRVVAWLHGRDEARSSPHPRVR